MSLANKNLYGGTLFTAFAFNWVMNWWMLTSIAGGVMPDHAVLLSADICFLLIFAAMTYGFGFFSGLLFLFLLVIDLMYLLKIIAGVLTPSAGTLEVRGKISALLELGIGFNPDMTGQENIYFSGTIMGYSREEMDARVDDIQAFADIGDFIHQPMKTYSSGMFVRLAFAVATKVDPEILVVDEALAVGDMFFQSKCTHLMKRMIDSGVTLLYVSHDTSSVTNLCRRSIYLENGMVKTMGPPTSRSICG